MLPRKNFITGLTAATIIASVATAMSITASVASQGEAPADLRPTIGFMSLVKLPCEYSPAVANVRGGKMTFHNPTSRPILRGIPVVYRLSATGEEYTVHLKSGAAPLESTIVEHRHADSSKCEAWAYLR